MAVVSLIVLSVCLSVCLSFFPVQLIMLPDLNVCRVRMYVSFVRCNCRSSLLFLWWFNLYPENLSSCQLLCSHCGAAAIYSIQRSVVICTDLHIYNLDAVHPIYVLSNHVDTDKLTTANGGTPVAVANHVKARQSPIERAVTWLATESSWA